MHVSASVNYHVHKNEPQAFEFDVDGIIGNLISPELVTTPIDVRDLRDQTHTTSFDANGIVFVDQASAVEHFEHSQEWQATYDAEIQQLLKSNIGAKDVIVFDHTVRIDDPKAARRPARNVHNDYNQAGAEQRLIDIVGEVRAEKFHDAGYGFVNVWRPVEHTIKSSPLGFIRPGSMTPGDWMDIGLIYPDRFGQILGVAANPAHEWFFKSEMTPEEAIIFNIYDSTGRPHLAHSALDMPGDIDVTVPRKSIESRTLVRYA
ncbi:MAG: CmcJ/NvfI family oxidoreductase [Pseudomonadota bacterium]